VYSGSSGNYSVLAQGDTTFNFTPSDDTTKETKDVTGITLDTGGIPAKDITKIAVTVEET